LRAALAEAGRVAEGGPVPQVIADAERHVTDAHAAAVRTLLEEAGLAPRDIALLGFHGQTILHRPKEQRTWQIGDGARLAQLVRIDVVDDFRSADVKAGGEGAPFVPLYHAALAARLTTPALPLVIANIGGVANVTFVAEGMLLAFDTGPGNAAIDDWAFRHTGQPVDRNGALASSGRVDEATLATMLAHPYFDLKPPKSLDRADFGPEAVAQLSPQDGAATLTAFTAAALVRARDHFPRKENAWIIVGGGRHNPATMRELRARLDVPVLAAEDAGWRGDFIEAEAFAYLAARSRKGLPLSLPTTTGVRVPQTGGRFHHAAREMN
jgi:anhydro-N-acetylmuramic acid kinase